MSERPRQRKLSHAHDKDTLSRQKSTKTPRRKRKNVAISTAVPHILFLIALFCVTGVIVLNTANQLRLRGILGSLRKNVRLEYQSVYEEAYRKKGYAYMPEISDDNDFLSTDSYGQTEHCSLTVLLLDPRIATDGPGQPVWFALESVALHTDPETCFLLQTTSCTDEHQTFRHIYAHSLPHFRHAIEERRVRVTLLQHSKYNMDSCDDFNPNAAFLNKHYWTDEFIDADSDVVLVVQADTILCRDLDLVRFQPYAWVGAVWPQQATPDFPEPMDGMCRAMPARWKSWLRPQRLWEKEQQQKGTNIASQRPKPHTMLPLSFPAICQGGIAPVGNGGLSLRQRTWIIRAIEACPHAIYSGHNLTMAGCNVLDKINEDFYFGTVLRGMNAPLPTGYEASLFSSETLWPEDVIVQYGGKPTGTDLGSIPKIEVQGRTLTVPTGFHKPWAYQSKDLLVSHQLERACPFLRYVIDES